MLERAYCGKGYGLPIVQLFMERLSEISMRDTFYALVEPVNRPSRKMLGKLGAIPSGVVPWAVRKEQDMEALEEENLALIDESFVELAEKFNDEPRKLLSHMLRFELTI